MAKQRNPQKTQWRYTFDPRTAEKLNILCKVKNRNGDLKYNNNETLVVTTAIDLLYSIHTNPKILELIKLQRSDGSILYNEETFLVDRAVDWLYEAFRTHLLEPDNIIEI